jgi:hypothetical protein
MSYRKKSDPRKPIYKQNTENNQPTPESKSSESVVAQLNEKIKINLDSSEKNVSIIVKQEKNEKYWKKLIDPLFWATLLLVVATIYLYKQAVKESDINEDTFEKTHTPFLQLKSVDTIVFRSNQQAIVKLSFENLSDFPLKIIDGHVAVLIAPPPIIPTMGDYLHGQQDADNIGEYVIKEHPLGMYSYTKKIITKNDSILMSSRNYDKKEIIFEYGHFLYKNLVNDSIRSYTFNITIDPVDHTFLHFYDNENYSGDQYPPDLYSTRNIYSLEPNYIYPQIKSTK